MNEDWCMRSMHFIFTFTLVIEFSDLHNNKKKPCNWISLLLPTHKGFFSLTRRCVSIESFWPSQLFVPFVVPLKLRRCRVKSVNRIHCTLKRSALQVWCAVCRQTMGENKANSCTTKAAKMQFSKSSLSHDKMRATFFFFFFDWITFVDDKTIDDTPTDTQKQRSEIFRQTNRASSKKKPSNSEKLRRKSFCICSAFQWNLLCFVRMETIFVRLFKLPCESFDARNAMHFQFAFYFAIIRIALMKLFTCRWWCIVCIVMLTLLRRLSATLCTSHFVNSEFCWNDRQAIDDTPTSPSSLTWERARVYAWDFILFVWRSYILFSSSFQNCLFIFFLFRCFYCSAKYENERRCNALSSSFWDAFLHCIKVNIVQLRLFVLNERNSMAHRFDFAFKFCTRLCCHRRRCVFLSVCLGLASVPFSIRSLALTMNSLFESSFVLRLPLLLFFTSLFGCFCICIFSVVSNLLNNIHFDINLFVQLSCSSSLSFFFRLSSFRSLVSVTGDAPQCNERKACCACFVRALRNHLVITLMFQTKFSAFFCCCRFKTSTSIRRLFILLRALSRYFSIAVLNYKQWCCRAKEKTNGTSTHAVDNLMVWDSLEKQHKWGKEIAPIRDEQTNSQKIKWREKKVHKSWSVHLKWQKHKRTPTEKRCWQYFSPLPFFTSFFHSLFICLFSGRLKLCNLTFFPALTSFCVCSFQLFFLFLCFSTEHKVNERTFPHFSLSSAMN